jgi:hypothetical protein
MLEKKIVDEETRQDPLLADFIVTQHQITENLSELSGDLRVYY